MKGRRLTNGAAAAAIALLVAGCGGSSGGLAAGEPRGDFPVQVTASFPGQQHLAQNTDLVVSVKNIGSKTVPNVAVTLTNPAYGTAAQSFGLLLPSPAPGQPIMAGRSRPVWIVNQAPGPCQYSCHVGGPGAAATAYSDTWALGRLAPGQTAHFDWHVTAVRGGTYTVAYTVAAGLGGNAHAVGNTTGRLPATISTVPRQAFVNNAGQVVSN